MTGEKVALSHSQRRRVAIYCRVSTAEQHTEPQLHALRQYVSARGLQVAGEYLDHGVSGAKDRRPALDRLMADARRRAFDVLAVTKLDRLARSVRHLTALAAELEALVSIWSCSTRASIPPRRLDFLFNTLSAVAELERDLIRERTEAGLAAAKRRGVRSEPRIAPPRYHRSERPGDPRIPGRL